MVYRARCIYDHRRLGFLEKVKGWVGDRARPVGTLVEVCVRIYCIYAYDMEACVALLLFIAAMMRTSFTARRNRLHAPFVFVPACVRCSHLTKDGSVLT